jgi:hypothetical protein
MLPSNVNYPMFQPDQLLTSDNLNQLFGYLEEQGRLTRTNLIGMGVVCGLEVKTSADGTSITISKGCGITSEGYLVSVKETTYTFYKPYNAVQDLLYGLFVDGSRNQLYPLNELKEAGTEENTVALSTLDLSTKVVLIFVEILEDAAKNCNPDSCDDKGVNVTVSFKPLLIEQADADKLGNGSGAGNIYLNLAELKIKKVDVPATTLSTASTIFQAYLTVISQTFLAKIETQLDALYTTFSPLIADLYPNNPFTGLADSFSFLHDNTLTASQLTSIQYFYDLFSDVIFAYEEFRKVGTQVISECCSDNDTFPRHLLLGLATAPVSAIKATYRNYFIPSPILQGGCCGGSLAELRALFTRIVLLLEKFTITPQMQSIGVIPRRFFDTQILFRNRGPVIRITPSKYGDVPLSKKAIPYYYNVTDGVDKLYAYWNYGKTYNNRANKNLSYHAVEYNSTDEFVTNPLLYDLEEYNFLRIEGHIGMPYATALQSIQDLKNQNRLPFQVLALSGDINQLKQQISNLTQLNSGTGLADSMNIDPDDVTCQFQDMESLYDALSAELICKLCMEMEYFYNQDGNTKLPTPASTVPQVSLLADNDAAFRFTPGSFGHLFENYYATIKNQPYIGADVFIGTFNYALRENLTYVRQNNSNSEGFALLYHMQKLYEALTDDLTDFDIDTFDTRYDDFMRIANEVKGTFSDALQSTLSATTNAAGVTTPGVADADTMQQEDLIDHIDDLIYLCKKPQFDALYKDYVSRWLSVLMLQRFGYFISKHPGISHKAGVTVGGTFIIVYHEQATASTASPVGTIGGIATAGGFSLKDIDVLTQTGRVSSGLAATLKNEGAVMVDKNLGSLAAKEASTIAAKKASTEKAVPKIEKREVSGITDTTTLVETVANDPAKLSVQDTNIKLTRTNLSGIYSGAFRNTIDGLLGTTATAAPPAAATQNLDAIIADIDDGTVIADFFLPYLCYSDCPPVNFIINNPVPPPAPDPTISIDPLTYCNNNSGSYPFTLTPADGQVTGEGVENNAFIPASVVLDEGAAKKDVTITYTENGKTATIVLTVYAMPVASFSQTPNPSAPLNILFNNTSAFGDGFNWVINNTNYTGESTSVTFSGDGTYTATLTVTNGPCSSDSVSQDVVIQTTPTVVLPKCMPLKGILADYQTLKTAKAFPGFSKYYADSADVDAMFTKLDGDNIGGRAIAVQMKFFAELASGDILLKWIQDLDKNMTGDFSLQSLTLYRILADLTMYISCIQPEDTGSEQIKMDEPLKIINGTLRGYIKQFTQTGSAWTDQLNQLLADLKDELGRIDSTSTPNYYRLIATLISFWGGQ